MKKIYMISRVTLAVIALVLFSIIMKSEESSWNLAPILSSLEVFVFSFLSTIFAKKIIEKGNKIENKFSKIAYYSILPIILLSLCLVIYMLITYICNSFPNEIGLDLTAAIQVIYVSAIGIIIILPYIQVLIINILKKTIKY